jgi:hypothetical protein
MIIESDNLEGAQEAARLAGEIAHFMEQLDELFSSVGDEGPCRINHAAKAVRETREAVETMHWRVSRWRNSFDMASPAGEQAYNMEVNT